jgi:dynamin-binding protein
MSDSPTDTRRPQFPDNNTNTNNHDPFSSSTSAAPNPAEDPKVLFTVASIYEFNIDRARQDAGIPYLTYVAGEIFDVVGERGELWLARNQDDESKMVGWIWCKHFAKLAG